jgi:penicillin-binding protein 1A
MTPARGGPHDRELLDALRARRQRAKRRRRTTHRRRAGLVATALAVLVAGGLLATLGFGGAVAYTAGCSLSSLHAIPIGQNTFIYAADGSRLGSIPSERNRQPVRWAEISPWMAKATVAVEDKRFWEHGGIDPIGMTRAFWADLKAGKVVQGGSTITQQLVRNLYISREQTLTRKIREACLSVKLAHKWSKQRILTAYLNQVYYGSQAYGVEAAAQTYFSEPASRLTLAQAALLAGLPQAPSRYDPLRYPQAARARRAEVLRAMLDTGAITRAQYRRVMRRRDLNLKIGALYRKISQPYFFDYVRAELVRAYGERRVSGGGLRVYTTIDPRLQSAARTAIRDTLYLPDDPAAAVVAINPATGAIRAMTAVDPESAHNQFNLAAQAHRQAGSTFKTFVLAAAIQAGMDPETTYYLSAPLHCDTGPCIPPWDVKTYDNTYVGSVSVANATLRSDNTVYARLTLDVGADKVAAMAAKLGVRTPLAVRGEYVPAMGLGAIAVTPLDMASAYATLASGGVYSKPMAIKKVILPNGKVDTSAGWGKPQRTRVVSPGLAYEVTKILAENVQYGTGVGANFGRPAAGKTGTTDNHADAWFCGYAPQLDAAVWVGYPRGEIPMENVHGIAVAGGTFPATIWHGFMQSALEASPTRDFVVPSTMPTYTYWHGEWEWSGGVYVPPYTPTAPGSTSTSPPTSATTTVTTQAAAAPPPTPPRQLPPPRETVKPTPPPAPPPPAPTTTVPPATGPPATTTEPPPAPGNP